jgi:hypothetical protein
MVKVGHVEEVKEEAVAVVHVRERLRKHAQSRQMSMSVLVPVGEQVRRGLAVRHRLPPPRG